MRKAAAIVTMKTKTTGGGESGEGGEGGEGDDERNEQDSAWTLLLDSDEYVHMPADVGCDTQVYFSGRDPLVEEVDKEWEERLMPEFASVAVSTLPGIATPLLDQEALPQSIKLTPTQPSPDDDVSDLELGAPVAHGNYAGTTLPSSANLTPSSQNVLGAHDVRIGGHQLDDDGYDADLD